MFDDQGTRAQATTFEVGEVLDVFVVVVAVLVSPTETPPRRPTATGHRTPATGHRPPATGHRTPATGHRTPATGGRRPPDTGPDAGPRTPAGQGTQTPTPDTGHRPGRRTTDTGHWTPATAGHRTPDTTGQDIGHRPPTESLCPPACKLPSLPHPAGASLDTHCSPDCKDPSIWGKCVWNPIWFVRCIVFRRQSGQSCHSKVLGSARKVGLITAYPAELGGIQWYLNSRGLSSLCSSICSSAPGTYIAELHQVAMYFKNNPET